MLAEWRLKFLESGAQFSVSMVFRIDISRLRHKGLCVGSLAMMTAFLTQYGYRLDRVIEFAGFVITKFVAREMKEI